MELSWLQSLFLGLISGFAEILPVSAQAHRLVIEKFFGVTSDPVILRLMIHLGTLAALHFCCRRHIVRMMRAYRLSKIPKNRRKRPLDVQSLTDFNLLKTTLIPVVLVFLLYGRIAPLSRNLLWIAVFLLVNGIVLYVPPYLPGSNRESGAMSRVDGLLMGLGSALGAMPGISCVGAATSVGTVRGMEPKTALNLAFVMQIPVTIGFVVWDLLDLFRGLGQLSFGALAGGILAAAAAFAGVFLGIKAVRKIADTIGLSVFGFYSWGAALFTFIVYLTAA